MTVDLGFQLLTPPKVAKLCGKTKQWVLLCIESGKLPAINVGTAKRSRWLVRDCDLREFLTPDSKKPKPEASATTPRRRRLDADVPKVL